MMSPDQLAAFLDAVLPDTDRRGEVVEATGDGYARLRLPLRPDYVRHGVVSGPIGLGFADTTLFAAAQTCVPPGKAAMIVNLNTTFVGAAAPADMIGEAQVIRAGSTLVFLEGPITTDGADTPFLRVNGVYRVVPFAPGASEGQSESGPG